MKSDWKAWNASADINNSGRLNACEIIRSGGESVVNLRSILKDDMQKLGLEQKIVDQMHGILVGATGISSRKEDKPKAPTKYSHDPLGLIEENRQYHTKFVELCKEFAGM